MNDGLPFPPISSDPPFHTWARRLLLPAVGPSAIDMMTPITRALANSLIDEHFSDGHGDAAANYAQHIPVRVIAQMIGIPLDDEALFTSWVVRTLQEGFENLANIPDVFTEMTAYFVDHIAARQAMDAGDRPDDIIKKLIEVENAEPINDNHLPGTGSPLLVAGMNTQRSHLEARKHH